VVQHSTSLYPTIDWFYALEMLSSLNNYELSATIMTNSSPDHNTSTSKTVGLVHTLVRKTFPTPVSPQAKQPAEQAKEPAEQVKQPAEQAKQPAELT
jgi:hypothetical protein